jgi:hypothetical protein
MNLTVTFQVADLTAATRLTDLLNEATLGNLRTAIDRDDLIHRLCYAPISMVSVKRLSANEK